MNPKTIRYYESIGVLPEPERTASGYRDYAEDAATQLTFIRTAQRLGISLDEIREILAFQQRGEAPCGYVRGVLDQELAQIEARIRELQDLRDQLVDLAAEAAHLPPAAAGETCSLIEHVRSSLPMGAGGGVTA